MHETLHLGRLQTGSLIDVLLGRDTEEDWLVMILRIIFVVCKILDGCNLILLLNMLLHVRNERICCLLHLGRVELVWSSRGDFGGQWRLGRIGLASGYCF